jgi:PAS domain S-box-containing protein
MVLRDSFILVSYLPDDPIFTRKLVNDEYCRFFGVAAEDVTGRSCLQSTPDNKRLNVRQKLRYCIQNDAVLVSIERNLLANGSLALIRWIDIPVKDKAGSIVELLAIGSPMKDRRENGDRRKPDKRKDY